VKRYVCLLPMAWRHKIGVDIELPRYTHSWPWFSMDSLHPGKNPGTHQIKSLGEKKIFLPLPGFHTPVALIYPLFWFGHHRSHLLYCTIPNTDWKILPYYSHFRWLCLTQCSTVLSEKLRGSSQEIPCISWNLKIHYHIYKRPYLSLSWTQSNQSMPPLPLLGSSF